MKIFILLLMLSDLYGVIFEFPSPVIEPDFTAITLTEKLEQKYVGTWVLIAIENIKGDIEFLEKENQVRYGIGYLGYLHIDDNKITHTVPPRKKKYVSVHGDTEITHNMFIYGDATSSEGSWKAPYIYEVVDTPIKDVVRVVRYTLYWRGTNTKSGYEYIKSKKAFMKIVKD